MSQTTSHSNHAHNVQQVAETLKPAIDATSPDHYKKGGLEVLDIWKAKLSPEEFIGLCKGNVLKYVIRANHKNGLEDLKKARVYLNWLIEAEEKKVCK